MAELDGVLAIYGTHHGAEEAVKELQHAGIDMRSLSIIARDSPNDQRVVGCYNDDDGMKYWGRTAAFWGDCWRRLTGSGFFAIPGIGPVLVAGPLVSRMVEALEGAASRVGLSVIGTGLHEMGVPKNNLVKYEMAVRANRYLLMVYGTPADAEKARAIIASTWPINVTLHSPEFAAAAAR